MGLRRPHPNRGGLQREVKLTGSVQTSTQKADAESTARAITNVREVDSNDLAVNKSGEGEP
jgi:osmotically-inducible protein OsmY